MPSKGSITIHDEIGRKQHAERASGPTSPCQGAPCLRRYQVHTSTSPATRRWTLYMVENRFVRDARWRCALWRDLVYKQNQLGCLSRAIVQSCRCRYIRILLLVCFGWIVLIDEGDVLIAGWPGHFLLTYCRTTVATESWGSYLIKATQSPENVSSSRHLEVLLCPHLHFSQIFCASTMIHNPCLQPSMPEAVRVP